MLNTLEATKNAMTDLYEMRNKMVRTEECAKHWFFELLKTVKGLKLNEPGYIRGDELKYIFSFEQLARTVLGVGAQYRMLEYHIAGAWEKCDNPSGYVLVDLRIRLDGI